MILKRILLSKRFKRRLPCFRFNILSITVDKSCRHRMHLHSFILSFSHFLHSLILFPLMRLLPCFLASFKVPQREKVTSLLPYFQREKVVRTHKKLLPKLECKSLYNSGAQWELITPRRTTKSKVSEARSLETWHFHMTRQTGF